MTSSFEGIARAPWGPDFPDVIVHADEEMRNRHPDYSKAKTGDISAAYRLVRDFVSDSALESLQALGTGGPVVFVAVSAIEAAGFNAIPDALARYLSDRLDFESAAGELMQSTRVSHTRSRGWHRLVTPATFVGVVRHDTRYVLVDDHVGFGGTLANLRGTIELLPYRNSKVVGMTCLTETIGGRRIAIRPETLSMLEDNHGKNIDHLWRDHFGYGTDCFTDIEGGYLARAKSIDAIRNRMAKAAERARAAGLPALDIG